MKQTTLQRKQNVKAARQPDGTVKCEGGYSNGKFETDSISVTSPKGGRRSVWLHYNLEERGFSEEVRNQFRAIVSKFADAYADSRKFHWAETQKINALAKERGVNSPIELPEWADHINTIKTVCPGLYTFYINLTPEELKVIDMVSDQSYRTECQKAGKVCYR